MQENTVHTNYLYFECKQILQHTKVHINKPLPPIVHGFAIFWEELLELQI